MRSIMVRVLGLCLVPLLFVGTANAATSSRVVGYWPMTETAGSVLHDRSGNHLDGTIGPGIVLTGKYLGFPYIPHKVEDPEREVSVPDNPMLDPGKGYFSVSVDIWWGPRIDRNIVQKGQGSPVGGMFKIKSSIYEPAGSVFCLFRGPLGDSTVKTQANLVDKHWHNITCTRSATGVRIFVDGKFVDYNPKPTGYIDNNWPLAIGGNTYCPVTECNYWNGHIRSLTITK